MGQQAYNSKRARLHMGQQAHNSKRARLHMGQQAYNSRTFLRSLPSRHLASSR